LIAKPDAKTTYPFTATSAEPTFKQNLNPTELKGALITPDYRYRLDYLKPVRGSGTTATPVTAPPNPATGATGAQYAQSIAAAANARTDEYDVGVDDAALDANGQSYKDLTLDVAP
jgi:hypothetical protein